MKPIESPIEKTEPKEFYANSNAETVNNCIHAFDRLSPSRVLCRKCGLGFFDNPFNPFPVDEINKQIVNEQQVKNYHKRKNKKVDNSQ